MPHRSPTLPESLLAAIRKETPRYENPGIEESSATIASYNIHKCVGTDGRFDPERTSRVVAEIDADVIALQEADERTGNRQGLLDLRALEKTANLVSVHTPDNPRSHGWHGNLILAREGVVRDVRRLRLPGLEPRGALIVDLELKGVPLRIIAAHLGLLRRSRSSQTTALLKATHSVLRPTILLGDLNEWRVRTRSSLLTLVPHFGPIHAVLPSFPVRFSAACPRSHPGAAAEPDLQHRGPQHPAVAGCVGSFADQGAPGPVRRTPRRALPQSRGSGVMRCPAFAVG